MLHSRVSNSNLKLLKRLGAEVAFCSPMPAYFLRVIFGRDVQRILIALMKGIQWADVLMCLRIQHERHDMSIGLSIAEYRDYYHIGSKQLRSFLNQMAVILHPGPYVCGVEIGKRSVADRFSLSYS